ncbi:glycosyltransferase family 2 protein [Maricaulis sp. CAU 1757]
MTIRPASDAFDHYPTARDLSDPAQALRRRLWSIEAANGLSRRSSLLSARPPQETAWLAGPVGTSGGSRCRLGMRGWSVFLAVGLMIGLVLCPDLVALAAGLAMWPGVSLQLGLRGLALFVRPRYAPRRSLPDAALPRAALLVALYDEADILPDLVQALANLEYAADRVEFLLVLEEDDLKTRAAAAALPPDPRRRVVVVPPGRPRTKPRALNYALRFTAADMITVYDAEDRPHRDQLRIAAESFAAAGPDLAVLQAPLNWYNAGECWLTRQFSLEYAGQFHALLPLYQSLGWPLPLGGTSNHFRRAALDRVGQWDAWNVTEDADLGLRLHRHGYRAGLIRPTTLEEAPISCSAWTGQRTRWLKGYTQTLIVHWRQSGPERWQTALLLGATVLSAALHLPVTLICLGMAFFGCGPVGIAPLVCGLVLVGYFAGALCAVNGMRRANLAWAWSSILTLPLYWALHTIPAWRAIFELARRPFHWEKTRHGISRVQPAN